MPTVDIYSKGQTDTLLSAKANTTDLPSSAQLVPSTSGATAGDVLTFDGSSVDWAAGGGSSGMTRHTYATFGAMRNDILAHFNECIVFVDYFDYYKNPVELISNNQKTTLDIVMTRINYSTSGNGSMSINRYRTGTISSSDSATSKSLYYSYATLPVSGTLSVHAETLDTYTFDISQFSVYY